MFITVTKWHTIGFVRRHFEVSDDEFIDVDASNPVYDGNIYIIGWAYSCSVGRIRVATNGCEFMPVDKYRRYYAYDYYKAAWGVLIGNEEYIRSCIHEQLE